MKISEEISVVVRMVCNQGLSIDDRNIASRLLEAGTCVTDVARHF